MIVTRSVAIPVLRSVVVALVTSTIRGIRTEVPLGAEQGLARECVANCDNLFTVPKAALGRHRGTLDAALIQRLDEALRTSLDLESRRV